MPRYMKFWNAGFGESFEEAGSDNQAGAIEEAYQDWKDEAEGNADYRAEELTVQLCADYGLDPLEYGLTPSREECIEHFWELEDYGYEPEDD